MDEQSETKHDNISENAQAEPPKPPSKYCQKCGKEIDIDAAFCSKCGSATKAAPHGLHANNTDKLNDVKTSAKNVSKTLIQKAKALDKRLKIAVIAVVAVLIVCIIFLSIPSPRESVAIDAAKSYKSMMKNPESMTIHGDVIVNDNGNTSDGGYYVFIDVSGENSYGGTNRDVAMFTESGYVGSKDDEVDVDGYSSKSEIDDALSKSLAAMQYAYIQMGGVEEDKYGYVSGEKVAKAVGAKYSE